MSDSNDHTGPVPPPEHHLPPDSRSRMREELLDATRAGESRAPRPWLVPGLAAAAVLSLVAAGVWTLGDDDGTSGNGTRQVQPAGGGDPTVPPTLETTRVPTDPAPRQTTSPGPDTTVMPTPTKPPDRNIPPTDFPRQSGPSNVTCQNEVRALGIPGLQGAMVTAERDSGPATTYLYETKTHWVVCDDFPVSDGGKPTLLSPHAKSQRYQPDQETLAISSNHHMGSGSESAADQFFAAGRDFDRVQSISYTFPDGHTEDAVVGQNGLWSMTYLPTDGVLADPRTNYLTLDPITVEVGYTGGDSRTFTLAWGTSDCAQVNHGC